MKYGVIQTQKPTIIFGVKRNYIGVAPYPVVPNKGDRWQEYDNADNFIEDWVYNGTYWLSLQTYVFERNESVSSAFNSTTENPLFPIETNSNIFLLNFILSGVQNITSSASPANNWDFTIARISNAGAVTNIIAFSTLNPTPFIANAWNTVTYSINTIIDVAAQSARSLRITLSRVGTVTKVFSYKITYRKIRI